MAIDMSQFYQVFFEESDEHLAAMEGLLLDLDIENPDPEQLNAIFRAAHSIKGSAGTFGFTDLAETTHILENLLDRIRKRELSLRADMVDAFLQCGDLLKGMLSSHQGGEKVAPEAVADICARLRNLSVDAAEQAAVQPSAVTASIPDGPNELPSSSDGMKVFDIQFVPTVVSAQTNGVAGLIESLTELGELKVVSQPNPASDGVGFWQLQLITDAEQAFFSDQIDFISDHGAWRVSQAKANDSEITFGFFENAPGLPVENEAYGLFEEVEASTVNSPEAAADEAYGFFEPLPAIATSAKADVGGAEESGGFGFFVPIEPQNTVSITSNEGAGNVQPSAIHAEVLTFSKKDEPAPRVQNLASPAVMSGESSIRVSVDKVDQLINLVGELVITQSMLLQTVASMADAAPERMTHGLAQLERNTRDLQESVMAIRMLPISFVFSRFPRVVRDLSGRLGKQVELKTIGETTELDKSLIERIADPLTHLIRNSLDHGIELPDQRVAAGKSPVGTITLKAYHQGGNIVIEVGDDGAGLPRDKILAKAKERGLASSDQMTDQEVFGLIFEAGFSTADQVTDVSGRGVGMDVVRRNIQSMGGRVEIDSMLGVGTRMTVRLPLTLAILDGMSVAVGDQTYILPLSYVIESLQPEIGGIKTLSNHARVIQVRGEFLPVVVLHEVFNIKPRWSDYTHGIMVVLDADGAKVALFVDALVGQHQVVIKSLEANYRRVAGVSGATIMGDGHVAMILDVSAIAGMAKSNMQKVG